MASAICAVCGRKNSQGHNVSHSNRKTLRTWRPNLQKVRLKVTGGGVRAAHVCARCIKGNRVAKA